MFLNFIFDGLISSGVSGDSFLNSFFDGLMSSGADRDDNPGLVLVAGLPRLPGAPRASLPACGDACCAWLQTSTEIKR